MTTEQMCANPKTRQALHNVCITTGMLSGSVLTWALGPTSIFACGLVALATFAIALRASK